MALSHHVCFGDLVIKNYVYYIVLFSFKYTYKRGIEIAHKSCIALMDVGDGDHSFYSNPIHFFWAICLNT